MTGGEGFLGKATLTSLLDNGFEVRILDRAIEDLCRPQTLKKFVEDSTAVIHLAGKNRASDADLYISNVVATIGLLNAIETYGIDDTLILHASSVQVYQRANRPIPLDESSPVTTANAFSSSKLLAESAIKKWSQNGKVKGICLRISNVYGPGCRPYYNSVVATFLDRARKGLNLQVNNGSDSRDFVFVSDVVHAILGLVKLNSPEYDVYNVSTGKGTTIKALAEMICKLFPNIAIGNTSGENREASFLVGSSLKLRNKIGFAPSISIEEGLKKTLDLS